MKHLWIELEEHLDQSGYMSGIDRSAERIERTAEIFTPTALVVDILKRVDPRTYAPGRRVIDPACGDGQFLVAVKFLKMNLHQMEAQDALAEIFGVDIMRDNIDRCKARLGGGNIYMGDSLNPSQRLRNQSDEEYLAVRQIFSHGDAQLALFD